MKTTRVDEVDYIDLETFNELVIEKNQFEEACYAKITRLDDRDEDVRDLEDKNYDLKQEISKNEGSIYGWRWLFCVTIILSTLSHILRSTI